MSQATVTQISWWARPVTTAVLPTVEPWLYLKGNGGCGTNTSLSRWVQQENLDNSLIAVGGHCTASNAFILREYARSPLGRVGVKAEWRQTTAAGDVTTADINSGAWTTTSSPQAGSCCACRLPQLCLTLS